MRPDFEEFLSVSNSLISGEFYEGCMFIGAFSMVVSCRRKFCEWQEEYIEHRGFGIRCVPNTQIRCNNSSVLALTLMNTSFSLSTEWQVGYNVMCPGLNTFEQKAQHRSPPDGSESWDSSESVMGAQGPLHGARTPCTRRLVGWDTDFKDVYVSVHDFGKVSVLSYFSKILCKGWTRGVC